MTKVQRYKVGYYTDEWGMSSNTPCLIPDDSGYAVKFEDYCKLETELAALKAELREICAAIDDPACDLTLTTVECIKKLKAENESLLKMGKIIEKRTIERCAVVAAIGPTEEDWTDDSDYDVGLMMGHRNAAAAIRKLGEQ